MRTFRALPFLLLVLAAACGPGETPPADTGVRNEALDIRLAAVPEGFHVVENDGSSLVLAPSGEGVEGRVTFSVGPPVEGVNLIAAMDEHQAEIEALPDGDYRGGQELQTPLGTAFYSRGRFRDADGNLVEETRILAIHPRAERLLTLQYRYPAADDSRSRVEALIGVFAQVE
jgi:hypothetical protein